MSKKRWLCFCVVAALALALMVPSALAEDTIFFTAVNNTLLELTAETMPVVHNSLIYVPCSVFNTQALNTWAYYSRGSQQVLISDGTKELFFDMSAGTSYDREENSYRYAALFQNDTAYVPVFFVADFFGMSYSYIRRDSWHIVRITTGSVLSDEDFFNAAAPLLETRLSQYLSAQETPTAQPAVSPTPTARPTPTPTPTPTPAVPSPSPAVDRSDVTVRLCFLGLGEESAGILEALEGAPACFFATAEQLYQNADLARRILGSGCALGLLIREDPVSEYRDFSRALRDTAMCASFLGAAAAAPETAEAWEDCGLALFLAPEALSSLWACAGYLEAAEGRCDLLLDASFAYTRDLLALLQRDHYTLEAVTEMTAGR